MICPACRNLMIVVEHKRIELDFCPVCHGAWFDSGELELLMQAAQRAGADRLMEETMNAPAASTREKKRKCPICSQRMKKVAAGEKPPVLIDVCPRAHGLWFDGGEVKQLLDQFPEAVGKGAAQSEVETFLKEVLKCVDTVTPSHNPEIKGGA